MCSVNDDLLDSITAQNILVHCSVQRYHCKLLAIGSRVYSYTLVSERVFERSVIDVFYCSELDCSRASTPPTADIGDRDTFRRRSLQPMAIGAHVRFRKNGPTKVGLIVSRAQMGVVREVFGNPYVPLYICHTL